MSANNDCMEAIKTVWDADATLTALELRSGRLVSPQTQPYAHLHVEQGPRDNEYTMPATTGGTYGDYRKVTLTVFGLYAAVESALDRIAIVFDWKTFTVPNATLLHCKPLNTPAVEPDPDQKDGEEIYRGIATYEVFTQRLVT